MPQLSARLGMASIPISSLAGMSCLFSCCRQHPRELSSVRSTIEMGLYPFGPAAVSKTSIVLAMTCHACTLDLLRLWAMVLAVESARFWGVQIYKALRGGVHPVAIREFRFHLSSEQQRGLQHLINTLTRCPDDNIAVHCQSRLRMRFV